MPIRGVLRWAWASLALLLACARPTTASPPMDAAAPEPIQMSSPAVVIDAGPGPLPGARLVALTDAEDGGEMDLTVPDASVPATVSLRFESTVPLDDLRIRVLTADDRLVDNRASISVDDGGTRALLKPLRAWPSRQCCTFRVDGEVNRLPSAGTTSYLPFELAFNAEPDPNAKPAANRPSHRHRR
jgi:hypothetical protein